MDKLHASEADWDESASAPGPFLAQTGQVFQSLFERSADAIWLFDPEAGVVVDCNQATVKLMGASSKDQLLGAKPEALEPPCQLDGSPTGQKTVPINASVEQPKGFRFEWLIRRLDGCEVPLEVSSTPIEVGGRSLHVVMSRDISERRKSERDLLELNQSLESRVAERTAALTTSEARFRALVEHAPEAIVVFDGDTGRFLFGNEHACRLYGVPMRRLAELTPAEVSPEFQPGGRRSSELAREKMQEALAGGTPIFEWVHRQPGGRLVPTEVRLLRLPAEGQNLIRASIIDNTERKQAEAELQASETQLRESEALFSAAFQASPYFIGILSMSDGAYVLANDAFVNWLGCPREEVLGRSSAEFGLWQDRDDRESALNDMRTLGSIRQRECRWFNRRGEKVTVLLSAETIMLNHTPHILSFALNITERNQAEVELRASEARLRESETRFSVAFQASPIFIGILRNSDGKFVLVNDALVSWLGFSRDEALGQSCADLGIWENLADRAAVLEELGAVGRIRQREYCWRNRRGRRFTVLLSADTITLDNSPHVLLLTLDITQRKQAEVEMLKALSREKELSQLKSNFVSMVSHEFRTPLGIIQSSAELLRDYFSRMQPAEREEHLSSITRNTRRMASMMEEILVLSRLDAGKLEFEPSLLSLDTVCRRIVDEVLSTTHRRCPIELSLESALPPALADERLLGHIFTNLLSNAVKYSEPAGAVVFQARRDGTDAVCVIRDGGIGISEADQQRLFTAFHRGANVGNRSGTGLGLLVVKRCVELHRGNLRIESQLGKGTMVTVSLPVFEGCEGSGS